MSTKDKHWNVPSRWKYLEVLTKEYLLDATLNHVGDNEISSKLGIHKNVIKSYRKFYGIPSGRSLEVIHKMRELKLNDIQVGILIGTLLGDACLAISKTYGKDAFLLVEQCEKQRDYVFKKYDFFKDICLSKPSSRKRDDTLSKNGVTYRFNTVQHPGLTYIHSMMYKDGRKTVTKDLLELLTMAGLAYWYFDDGSLQKSGKRYMFCTDNFSLDEVKLLREYLFKRWKLYTSIVRFNNSYGNLKYRLYVAKRSNPLFTSYLKPFVLPCMNYKVDWSSETERKAPGNGMVIQSELTGDSKSIAEMTIPQSQL